MLQNIKCIAPRGVTIDFKWKGLNCVMLLCVAHCFVSCRSALAVCQLNTKSEEKESVSIHRGDIYRRCGSRKGTYYILDQMDMKVSVALFISLFCHKAV